MQADPTEATESQTAADDSSSAAGDGNASGTPEQAADGLDLNVIETVMNQLRDYLGAFIQWLPNIAAALVVLVATFLIALVIRKLVGKAMKRAQVRPALIGLCTTLASVVAWILGLLVTMAILFPSVEPGSVLAALGVGGIAIGFAFKDIFENFMAGAMIMLRKPMRIGDFIECEGVEGKVEEIMIRDTYIRQTDGQLVILPNSMLYKNPVQVLTDRAMRRFEVVVGVSYDTDIDEARGVIRDSVHGLADIDDDRGVDVFAYNFNDSSVDFRVRWWSKSTPRDGHESTDVVVASIKSALDDAGIEIPFPYRTHTFAEAVRVEGPGSDSNSESESESDQESSDRESSGSD